MIAINNSAKLSKVVNMVRLRFF